MLEADERDRLLEADSRGINALHAAAGKAHRDVLTLLLDSALFNIDAADNEGATALLHAALAGCDACVRPLHRAGASIAARGATAALAPPGPRRWRGP